MLTPTEAYLSAFVWLLLGWVAYLHWCHRRLVKEAQEGLLELRHLIGQNTYDLRKELGVSSGSLAALQGMSEAQIRRELGLPYPRPESSHPFIPGGIAPLDLTFPEGELTDEQESHHDPVPGLGPHVYGAEPRAD